MSSRLVQPPAVPTLLEGGHPVAATRPIRSLAFLALGIMLSGPPSVRLDGGRDRGAALARSGATRGLRPPRDSGRPARLLGTSPI
jgi:hypothetical protein